MKGISVPDFGHVYGCFRVSDCIRLCKIKDFMFFKVSDVQKRDICSFQLTLQSNNAYKISLNENKSQPLGINDMNGLCLLINIHCLL